MRGAASLAYLLARTSDTLADTKGVPLEVRMRCLDEFERAISAAGSVRPSWPSRLLNAVEHAGEHDLLEISTDLLEWLARMPVGEAELIREVLGTIMGGQRLDIERFAGASPEQPVSLEDDMALEDYTWRVAGCVGAFWTKLGFLVLGDRFSTVPESQLVEKGIAFGKGLQLVNILRDLSTDLAEGRCYLPVADPHQTELLLEAHVRWRERASEWIGEGYGYARALGSRRLRLATVLPAMIARETLDLMKDVRGDVLRRRVKVPRVRVYLALLRAFSGGGR